MEFTSPLKDVPHLKETILFLADGIDQAGRCAEHVRQLIRKAFELGSDMTVLRASGVMRGLSQTEEGARYLAGLERLDQFIRKEL